MKYIIDVDIPDNKRSFVEDFFKTISFIKKVIAIAPNEITNLDILRSIEDYENGKAKPTPINLEELKMMIYA